MRSCLHVVIVNWNSGSLLRRCLASVARWGRADVERVIVVDNGSSDGSAELEIQGLPLHVDYTGLNLGFAAGSNRGAAAATASYLLFLNPDTELHENAFETALALMESAEGSAVGVCGIRLVGEDGATQRHCARFPSWRSFVGHSLGATKLFPRLFPPLILEDFDHRSSRDVDHVIGAFYLIRRSLFEELGGFDERFFVYLEDLDLSRRVAERGWRCHYLAEAVAFHKGGGTSENVKAHRLFYSLRSRVLYAFKHFSKPAAWAVLISTLLIEPVSRLILAGLRLSREDALNSLSAYRMLFQDLRQLLHASRAGK